MSAFEDAKRAYEVPWGAATALKAAIRGKEESEMSIEEEVGFLLLADFMNVARLFKDAYLKVK